MYLNENTRSRGLFKMLSHNYSVKAYENNENLQSAMMASYSDFETWTYELQNSIANHRPVINERIVLNIMA